MDFDNFEFEKNLNRKSELDSAPVAQQAEPDAESSIDIDSITIKDADDVPIYSYGSETPRDRKSKLAQWEKEKSTQKSAKQRRKKSGGKERKHLSARNAKMLIYLGCVVGVSLILTFVAWFAFNDCFAFTKKSGLETPVAVSEGEGLSTIAQKLKDNDIIDFKFAFKMYYRFIRRNTKVNYGTHYFNRSDDYDSILIELSRATEDRNSVQFLVTEGRTQEDIVSILSKSGIGQTADITRVMNFTEFSDLSFMAKLPARAQRLEGYLFPATYEVFENESIESVVMRMLGKFDQVFTEDMKQRAAELGMTVDEVVTLASIIQAEAGNEGEMPVVSSVFHNRLNSKAYGYLQSCATVQYTMSERKAILSYSDIAADNKYNTYKNPGLPIGPICNPGYAALEAALYPAETNYFYFVSDMKGGNVFTSTYSEHLKAIKKIRSGGGNISGTNVTDD